MKSSTQSSLQLEVRRVRRQGVRSHVKSARDTETDSKGPTGCGYSGGSTSNTSIGGGITIVVIEDTHF